MSELDMTIHDSNKPLQYNANDWFYMNTKEGESCHPEAGNRDLCYKNKCAVSSLQVSTDDLGASMMKYNDAKMLYNRELLFTVNILVGLALICYYIYVNQSAIPSTESAVKGIGAASTWTSKLAMSPTTAK